MQACTQFNLPPLLMCRILFLQSKNRINLKDHLACFAKLCKQSKEYQGHGWGVSTKSDLGWNTYRSISPIWEDDLCRFSTNDDRITCALVHARSAFRDEGITLENNMPFLSDDCAFIFNGELRGVKLKSSGRIGAEKLFNFILRMCKGDLDVTARALGVIEKRTDYLRAMNIVIANHNKAIVSSRFSEDPEYFGLHSFSGPKIEGVCSFQYSSSDITEWASHESDYYREFSAC